MSQDIFVIVEQRDGIIQNVSYELLGEANSLAQDLKQNVVAVILGNKVKDSINGLIYHGADTVYYVDHPFLKEYMTEPYTKAISQIIKEFDPEIVLFSATSIGRDLAPRISARIKTGLTADCTSLCIDPETRLLQMTRPAFGGNLMAVIECRNHRPQMATVRPGVMQPLEEDKSRKGEVKKLNVEFSDLEKSVEIMEVIKKNRTSVDISHAKCLISGGRGVGNAEGFTNIKQLADLLDGEVAASRAAVDAGWIGKEHQVGQTGKTVHPELYLACGISGAIQHVAGMESSSIVIAINKNDTAPIFDVADLGIVGDINVIIPKLIEAVKIAKAKGIEYIPPSTEQYVGLENVLYNVQNGIAYLTINRPKALNALNKKTLKEIGAVADMLRDDLSIKALIIRGAGDRAFVAGADITEMQNMDEKEGQDISAFAQEVFTKIKNLPQIVIGAINGYALGGGNELAMSCDIRIASSRAKFGQPEVNLGLLPGFTGTQRLSRLIGKAQAKQLVFSTEMISAEEAFRIGLVNKVVPPESLIRTARDLALNIMSKGFAAVRLAKIAINEGAEINYDEGLIVENEAWTDCFRTSDAKEGMTAFIEKRKAKFKDF